MNLIMKKKRYERAFWNWEKVLHLVKEIYTFKDILKIIDQGKYGKHFNYIQKQWTKAIITSGK